MMDVVDISKMENKLESFLGIYSKDIPLIFYGCGKALFWALKSFHECGITPVAICDSDRSKVGQIMHGMTVTSFEEEIKKYDDFEVFISAPTFEMEIREHLQKIVGDKKIHCFACELYCERDIKDYRKYLLTHKDEINSIYCSLCDEKSKETFENVLKGWVSYDLSYFRNVYSKNQYFPDEIVFSEEESFIDCGAFVGDTFLEFFKRTNGKFKKYYAFEPDEECFKTLTDTCKVAEDKVVLFNKGTYNKTATLSFSTESNSFGGASVNEKGNIKIDVVSIDNVISEKVTFIKMDIEGSELASLKGAEIIIKKYKPKLAICIYHKNEDIVEIPNYIMNLGLGYRIFIRHYNIEGKETVLYAI